ncbi:hypothetical protein CDD83_221 [Cordyceps sp. RAO-2017]|nr:hypothetical protein CDD83_221 [Cordyceps sp. RAO-2017]
METRTDSATLSWTKPVSNRPVQKYLIQVNGVHVGDSPGNETAITVTGLRPNHFYNLRVVAVGPNNFRAGSPVIRLRTFGKDGRPQLGDSRLPTSFVDPDNAHDGSDDENDRPDKPISSLPTVEPLPVLDHNATLSRDSCIAAPGQRRNTLNRRHSPSVASSDQPQARLSASTDPEMSLAELNEKFEGIRKEIDDTLALCAKEAAESQQQEEELKAERDRKRQALKEKEEQTAQLKTMIRVTTEQARAAEKERHKKEQQLKEKESKKAKVRDNITKFDKEVDNMKTDRRGFEVRKAELTRQRDRDVRKFDNENAELHENCVKLEAELKDKGKQLQDLKAARERLPGADDGRWREEDLRLRRGWENQRRDLHQRLVAETKNGHILNQHSKDLGDQLSMQQQQAGLSFYNQPASSNIEFEPSPIVPPKRLAPNGTPLLSANMSSPDRIPSAEPTFPGSMDFNAAHVPDLFMDAAADGANELQADMESKGAGGPLSPSAQDLLPSNIFEESEDAEHVESRSPFAPETKAAGEEGPQSPASSNMSFNLISSPHGSANHLPFPQFVEQGDGMSLNAHSSPPTVPATNHSFTNFLLALQRSRGAKAADAGGPPIGSLKSAQSQSFPSAADDGEDSRRKMILPAWIDRGSMAPDGISSGAPATTSRPLSALRLNAHKGSPVMAVADRDGERSRPASIASADRPRPSTDSSWIWGAPGDPVALQQKNRLWSLGGEGRWQSRSNSRRPSLQGSNVLTTTLASADDEILGEDELSNPQTMPSQVGVIGSRPPGPSKLHGQRLNPAAPTFMANFFTRKDRDKDRGKDRAKEDKGKGKEVMIPAAEATPSGDDSPSGSRASRDTHSVYTRTSVSESRESLQFDPAGMGTAAELNSPSASSLKDPEKVVRKLFRKGSSSKFSLSSRLGKETGLFKKGPGSAGNSDRNASAEHRSSTGDLDDAGDDIAVLGRSFDSVASSPSLGPSKSRESREGGRISSWRFSMSSIKKKGRDTPVKEKGGFDVDQAPDEE